MKDTKWSFPIDKNEVRVVIPDTLAPSTAKLLDSYFTRAAENFQNIKLSLDVQGVFSLPEQWKAKLEDPTEQQYQYQVRFNQIQVGGLKVVPKELTEEEKEQLDAKGKKGAPAKDDKKKKGQEEQLSPEEEQRLAMERLDREEMMERRQHEWDKMDSKTKYFRFHEDPFREPSIQIAVPPEELPSVELSGNAIIDFDDLVNQEGGCWIYFDKLPPQEEEDPKKAKAPAKGKAPTEEMKPVHGRAWVNLKEFQNAGTQEVTQRCLLKTILPQQEEGEEKNEEDLIFESAQTYVFVTMSLGEALNPYYTGVGVYPSQFDFMPGHYNAPEFPCTQDAINDFTRQIQLQILDISQEYTRMFAMENQDKNEAGSPKGKQQSTFVSTTQLREMRESRKEKIVNELKYSAKYLALKDKLKKSIYQLAVEKFNKTVGTEGLKGAARDKFKADLYTYLTEQLRLSIDWALGEKEGTIHPDLAYNQAKEERLQQKKKNFKENETSNAQHERLFREFDLIGDQPNAERYMKNFLSLDPADQARWVTYAKFALKYGMYLKAEFCFRHIIAEEGESQLMRLIMGGLLMQREHFKEAKEYLNKVLDQDWKHLQANLLMGIMFDQLERKGLSKKHFAIAKVKKLREMNKLQPKNTIPKNFRTEPVDFKVEIIDYNNVNTKDKGLDSDSIDQIYLDLVDFMLEYNLFQVADLALGYTTDRNTERFLLTQARIRILQKRYQESVEALDQLLARDPRNQKAWVLRGHSYFFANNLFDSEESYIKALRIKPPPKDNVLQERLGIVYAKRKAWKDARVVFMKCCKEFTSTTSWIYLGLALMRLGEMPQAEDAFTQANILDNLNPKVWGYMTILCLNVGKERQAQAELSFKEALGMGLRDIEILEEIGDLYMRNNLQNKFELSLLAFRKVSEIDPEHGEGWQKLGDVYTTVGIGDKEGKEQAVEAYKRAIELVEGENNKAKIALTLQELLQNLGREEEIDPFRKYLLEQSQTS